MLELIVGFFIFCGMVSIPVFLIRGTKEGIRAFVIIVCGVGSLFLTLKVAAVLGFYA